MAPRRSRGNLVVSNVSHTSLTQLRETHYGPVTAAPHPRRVMGKSESFSLCSWGPGSTDIGDDTSMGKQRGPIRKTWSSKQLANGSHMHELIINSPHSAAGMK
ncbi:g4063 [Coccomyxa viridis]|uniref:G4063 protein n=1 Tax=Coccomyxa viridis TaxID=1274662 RepID=A0ABP1FW92_9CHLO